VGKLFNYKISRDFLVNFQGVSGKILGIYREVYWDFPVNPDKPFIFWGFNS